VNATSAKCRKERKGMKPVEQLLPGKDEDFKGWLGVYIELADGH
jgi:hypothetical protein